MSWQILSQPKPPKPKLQKCIEMPATEPDLNLNQNLGHYPNIASTKIPVTQNQIQSKPERKIETFQT